MDQLLQKLVKSKAIMDASDKIKKVQQSNMSMNQPVMENFSVPQAKYNIPSEFLQETPSPVMTSSSRENTKPVGVPSVEAIKNSKLPDEIKKLMMEHPIQQAQQPQVTLSNDLVEKASRLMKGNTNNYIPESASNKQVNTEKISSNLDYSMIQKMIEEAVEKALRKNGLLVESSEKTGEIFSFKVGKHIFEGKVTKIKKLS